MPTKQVIRHIGANIGISLVFLVIAWVLWGIWSSNACANSGLDFGCGLLEGIVTISLVPIPLGIYWYIQIKPAKFQEALVYYTTSMIAPLIICSLLVLSIVAFEPLLILLVMPSLATIVTLSTIAYRRSLNHSKKR